MKKLIKQNKIIYIGFLILLLFVPILTFAEKNEYLLLLLSIISNLFLIIIYRNIIKKYEIKFTKIQKVIILLVILLIYIFYFISLINRNFIYYWDYSCYYNIQLKTKETFSLGLMDGIRYFIGSTYSGEYGNFLSFFPELIFNFTNRNIDSYIASCVIIYTPYIILALVILLKKLIRKYSIRTKSENKFMILTLLSFILFPILHATFIYGQPDLFGLAFIFLILALTIDYDFEKIEIERLILILLITFMLVISRRWYLYWIISYYLCYVLKIFITNFKDKEKIKKMIMNVLLYGSIVVVFFLITLFPLIKNILFSQYQDQYSYYLTGGLSTELISQIEHLGYIIFIIIIIGIIYGIIKKKYRLNTIITVLQYFIIVILFTKIQNMGLHHSLLLLPIYLYFICLFIIFSLDNKKKLSIAINILLVLLLTVNFIYGINSNTTNKLFTTVALKVPNQEDYYEIGKVAKWLQKNLNKENTAYMIAHNNKYNPDKFRNFYMPDTTISNYLPYGSAVIGVHKFPTELFTAKYIITTTPFDSISIEYKYNEVFNELVKENKFKLKKDFDMKKGYNVLIYERIKDVDKEEIQLYIDKLENESNKYPALYKDTINEFIQNNNIK